MNGAGPEVSFLVPVRNGEETLRQALESLRAQTFGRWEAIVVDDGSTDGTPTLLEEAARGDSRIRVLRQEAAGIVPALERARAEARGSFLARMDADDRAAPERLERQLRAMQAHPEWVLCGTHVRYFPRARLRAGARRYERWLQGMRTPDDIDRALFVECPIAHPTFLMRADSVEAVGGYRDGGWPEDYDLLLRLRSTEGRVGVVPEPLLDWRESGGRLSRRHPRYSPDAFRRCKVHFLRSMKLTDGKGVVIWGAGPVGKAFSKVLRAEGVELRGWVEVDPRKLGQEIHGAPVLEIAEGVRVEGVLHLGAVGQPGGRESVREAVREAGLEEGVDFVAVA